VIRPQAQAICVGAALEKPQANQTWQGRVKQLQRQDAAAKATVVLERYSALRISEQVMNVTSNPFHAP
jgi:hypothetical protein